MIKLALLASLLASRIAFANDEPTAAEVTGAPAAGAESGRVDEIDERDGAGRYIARGLLFIPRAVVTVVFAPIEGIAWSIERFQLVDRARNLFFNDAGTFGIFPTFQHDHGFGFNVGLRVVHRDLLGKDEHLDFRTQGGGEYKQRVTLGFTSGTRFGDRMSLELGGDFEQRPKDVYYGIGNLDDDMSTEGRFRRRVLKAYGAFDVQAVSALHVRGAGFVKDTTFGNSDVGTPIESGYMPSELTRYEDGVRNAYSEVELRWDSRGQGTDYDPPSIISGGKLVTVWAGRVTPLDDSAIYYRYGSDVQSFWRVGEGPRVIALRSHIEAVSGDLGEVPFSELPSLGGKDVLRGYPSDRFRDRIAMVNSIDYQFDLMANMSASLFVDWGRVQSGWDDLESKDMRVGYGVQFDLHTKNSFLARASLASSIDGGLFFNVGLDPVFELDGRVDRR
jgi:hypothetical protein